MDKQINNSSAGTKSKFVLKPQDARTFLLLVSVFAVGILSISLGDRLYRQSLPTYILAGSPDRTQMIDRAIASAQPYDLVEDIQIENDFAKRLSNQERAPAAIGTHPSRLDELRFGPLAGKYRILEQNSKVTQLNYVESQDVTDRPIFLRDRESFLKSYHDLLLIQYQEAKMTDRRTQSTSTYETFDLLDKRGNVTGQVEFQMDEVGRLLSMKVQEATL